MNINIKKYSLLTLGLASIYVDLHGRSISKEREKYIIPDKDLASDTEYKRKIAKKLKIDQILDILEDLAISRLRIKELEERIKVYEQLEQKLEDEKTAEITKIITEYEEKLKKCNAPGSGEIASNEFIAKIRAEGVDIQKIKYRVQIGEVSTYKAADKLKNKVRSLGIETWILPLYNGYVIPLQIILEQIKEEKC